LKAGKDRSGVSVAEQASATEAPEESRRRVDSEGNEAFFNTLLASPFLPLGNVVAANVVTGKARALAYAMAQSLNAFAVNTDGVLFRGDRIPAVPLAKCLARSPNYPLQQACGGSRIPFLQPETIPEDDAGFTEWYRVHAGAFFGVAGRPEYAALFGLHNVEHKLTCGAGASFDALFVYGVANHGKLIRTSEGNWTVRDFKARGIPEAAKMEVAEKLLRVCERDYFEAPLELVPAERTLDAAGATAAARCLLEGGAEVAHWPLGLSVPARVSYKLIKPSQFLFRTAAQRKGMMAAWGRLVLKTDCGFELLSLRRTYGNSLAEVARAIFDLIEAGDVDLAGLNLDRLWRRGEVGQRRKVDAEVLRSADRQRFAAGLIVNPDTPEWTGLQVGFDGLLKLLPPQ